MLQRIELAVGLGTIGLEGGVGVFTIGGFPFADRIGLGFLGPLGYFHLVDPRTVKAKDLRLEVGGQLRIAVGFDQLGGDLKAPKRLDLILRRAIPSC